MSFGGHELSCGSLDIYNGKYYYSKRSYAGKIGSGERESRNYYRDLSQSIVREIRACGCCTLLSHLLCDTAADDITVDAVTVGAICNAEQMLAGACLESPTGEQIPFVKSAGMTWRNAANNTCQKEAFTRDYLKAMLGITDAVEKLHKQQEVNAEKEQENAQLRQRIEELEAENTEQPICAQPTAEWEQERQQLEDECTQLRSQLSDCEQRWQEQTNQDDEMGEKMRAHIDDMCAQTSSFQREMITQLDDWKQQICQQIGSFQKDLYSIERGSLARAYTTFYELLECAPQQTPEETDFAQRLKRCFRQMERALVRLGMQTYRPARGDVFNDIEHCLRGEQKVENGVSRIYRCVVPGVLQHGMEDEVLIRAEVEIEE